MGDSWDRMEDSWDGAGDSSDSQSVSASGGEDSRTGDTDVNPSPSVLQPSEAPGRKSNFTPEPNIKELALLLGSAMASGIVGNAAYDAIKAGVRHIKSQPQWDDEGKIRPYVEKIAQLIVLTEIQRVRGKNKRIEAASFEVLKCKREAQYWITVVLANDKAYKVLIPAGDVDSPAVAYPVEVRRRKKWTSIWRRRWL